MFSVDCQVFFANDIHFAQKRLKLFPALEEFKCISVSSYITFRNTFQNNLHLYTLPRGNILQEACRAVEKLGDSITKMKE